MNYYKFSSIFAFTLALSGCSVISGFQTYNLPREGLYQTELGTPVNVVRLTQESLFASQAAEENLNDYAPLFIQKNKTYKLSAGDILSIYLWAYPEITPPTSAISNETSVQSNGYQIDQQGYIQFPMIGRYHAAGKSLTQINQELRQQLSRYLKTPDVVVRVLSYQGKHFSVQGNVLKAGQYALTDQPISLYSALGLAGGVNAQLGNNAAIVLVRNGRNYQLNTLALEKAGYSLHQLLIQPNDTIYVNARENQKIYIMGEAGKNQALVLRDQGMTLSDVLGESLGINPLSASNSRIFVVRSNQQSPITEIYHLDLSNIGDFGLANQFKVRSNDIVYVDSTGLTRWQRVVNQVIPFSNALYNFGRIGE
ncbi:MULTISPECIES: polysaccharide biosynthesis/export family protein [unclassified Acinetobacter]|uniref:polysaccharide biosynthesis/export family protein n=1 Tax=unclassified Acinetobacter TaxID=196816 RepID=UPI0029352ECB|nr:MULTISPECIES: polysaccharide biosynthesis/export family protein [unclassified Acinetobacter]WOE30879.1 polysaccharide biosynthesis/export family protein [Acinetobacter sp. SAAs470]WOE39074.1 polysaccharide biosynthesis/export family protein [Acinetobacter sp. SAAs474]